MAESSFSGGGEGRQVSAVKGDSWKVVPGRRRGGQMFSFQHWPTQIELKQLKSKKNIVQVTEVTTEP